MPLHPLLRAPLLASGISLCACGAGIERLPPGLPPTPETVTKKRPGGDAHDPHQAALLRQEQSDWGYRTDKDRQARFPLLDRRNWTRIRLRFVDHFTAFKYGDENHALTAAFIVPLKKGDPQTSEQCVLRFEEQALPHVEFYGGEVSQVENLKGRWQEKDLFVRQATGGISVLFTHYDVAMAWTGYPAYPDSCLIYSLVVSWDGHQSLAESVRNKWAQGFESFTALTESEPYRH